MSLLEITMPFESITKISTFFPKSTFSYMEDKNSDHKPYTTTI